jgi:4-carboxymuconolactone decarboxylase
LVQYTDDVVYGDLWERPGLSKRDRSLITLAALIAHLSARATHLAPRSRHQERRDKEEISEIITHLAFYAGWPSAMSAAQLAYTQFGRERTAEVRAQWRTSRAHRSASSALAPWDRDMAANLQKAGYQLVVHDLRQEAAASLMVGGAHLG